MVRILEQALTFDGVLIVPQHSRVDSRSDVDISTSIGLHEFSLPIVSSNMDTITGLSMAKKMAELGGLGVIHRYMSVKDNIKVLEEWDFNYKVAVSVGILKTDKDRIDAILQHCQTNEKANLNLTICVDIAHGDSEHMVRTIEYIRHRWPEGNIMAGAVCTPDGVENLMNAGANVVRAGVGAGSVCKTRTKTGCGYPQLSAIIECATAGPIIADGGITGGDSAAKALAAGSQAIMIGGMLSGTDCVPHWSENSTELEFRGMASNAARLAFAGEAKHEEGVSCMVPAKPIGSTEAVINELCEGITSAMSYSNSLTLHEFHSRAIFVKTTHSIVGENIPHMLSRLKG